MSKILTGDLVEAHAIIGDEKRFVSTMEDITIDPVTGEVSFQSLLKEAGESLRNLFLIGDDGRLTKRDLLHGFELHFYKHLDADAPASVYWTGPAEVDAEITVAVDDAVQLDVTVTPDETSEVGFKQLDPDEDDESEEPSERDALRISSGNLSGI